MIFLSPCNEEMRRAECVTEVGDVMNQAQETFKCDLDTSETLNSFDMPANMKTEMYEVKNEVTDVANPSLNFNLKDPCPATDGDCRLEESRLIKTEFNSDDMDEIHKHGLSGYESSNSFMLPEDITNLKYEIKNEEMDISYPAIDLKDSKALIEGSTSNRNYDSIIEETDKERQRVNRLSTGASKFKGDVTQSEKHFSFGCTLCDYSSDTMECLLNHMIVHSKTKMTFLCANCDYSTSYRYDLVQHMAFHNKANKIHKNTTFFCDLGRSCKIYFKSKHLLDDHILKVHKNFIHLVSSKVHDCHICDYRTTIKGNLRIHKINVHSENDNKYACKYCEKQFIRKRVLGNHIINSHPKYVDSVSSKVHSCQTCGYRTTMKSNLRAHKIRIHSENDEKH